MRTFTLTGDLKLLDGWVNYIGPHAFIGTGGPLIWSWAEQRGLNCGFNLTLSVRFGWFGRPLPGWAFGWRPWVLLTVEYGGQSLFVRFERYQRVWRCTAIEVDVILLCNGGRRLRQAILPSNWTAAVRHLTAFHINDGEVYGEPIVINGS